MKKHGQCQPGPLCPPWATAAERKRTPLSGFPGRETARSGEGPPAGNPMQRETRGRDEIRAPGVDVPKPKPQASQSGTPSPAEIRPPDNKTISEKVPPT